MRIVFFSSNSNLNDETSVWSRQTPDCAALWKKSGLPLKHEIIIYTQAPGMFLLDMEGNRLVKQNPDIRYIFARGDSAQEMAEEIISLRPELAVAATFWTRPFDWLSIKDSMIAEHLRKNGIRTFCPSTQTATDCFDKWRTHGLLERYGFETPESVYIHHELFMNAGNRRELKSNVYRDSVLEQISNLSFPVIVKDTTGLSSFGTDRLETYDEVLKLLHSKKFTSDKITEEYVSGMQFGMEIYGTDGNYTIFDPFIISTNKYGITSPKQNVKAGPVRNEKYQISRLKSSVLEFLRKINYSGAAQLDLIFTGEKWFIIEINPRLSGMSWGTSFSCGKTLYELLAESASSPQTNLNPHMNYTLDIKMPLTDEKTLSKLSEDPHVLFVSRTENPKAVQLREKGFCQVIFGGFSSKKELEENFEGIKKYLPAEEEETCIKLLKEDF